MQSPWQRLVESLRERCSARGLDLVQPFRVGWYNRSVDPAFALPDFGRPSALGVLVGNTRALWSRFLAALRADPTRLAREHPLDAFVTEAVAQALEPVRQRYEARFAHEGPPRRIAMQRLAHVSGLAYLAPSHLSVHAVYGPWVALRAAVVVDEEGPPDPPPLPPPACPSCEGHCLPRFREALENVATASPGHEDIAQRWSEWLAVRDACPVGRAYRYSDAQIRYHYTKDRNLLRDLIEEPPHE